MNKKGFVLFEMAVALIMMIIALLIPLGYFMNIYEFTQCDFKEPYKAEAIRGIGIVVAPLGIIAGYIDIKD